MQLAISSIEIAPSSQFESEFAEWYQSHQDQTKTLLLTAYYFIQNGIAPYYEEQYQLNQEQIWKTKYDELVEDKKRFAPFEVTLLQQEMQLLRKQSEQQELIRHEKLQIMEQAYATRLKQETLRLEQQLMVVEMERDKEAARYQEMCDKLADDRVQTLQAKLHERDQELSLLKKTNCGKGQLGENMIMAQLRELFPAGDIADSSKVKQSTDIHMKLDQSLFAFESKYKETITQGDIEKFYRDIDQLILLNSDNFVGAAFISLKTRNIPGKGDLFFDQVKNRPVIFIGFEDGIDIELFNSLIKLLVKIGNYNQSVHKQETTLNDLIEKLRPVYSAISRTRSDIENIKSMASKIIDSTVNLERDLNKGLTTLHSIVPDRPQAHQDTSVCPWCEKKFQNLKNHMRCCKSEARPSVV